VDERCIKIEELFYHTTSSMTMGAMAVTKALSWLETQAFTNVCILRDSMSMLRKIEAGWKLGEWLESLRWLVTFLFNFCSGVRGNERAEQAYWNGCYFCW
jgi:ribonuclease HI